MGQNEIFRLLLIILLLISNNDGCCDNSCHGLTGNLNQIIIIMLLLGFIPFDNGNSDDNNSDTTF